MKDQVKGFKLLNGEDVIATLTSQTTEKYTIKNPMVVVPQQHPGSQQMAFGFMPWLMFADDSSNVLDRVSIVTLYSPRSEILNAYKDTVTKFTAAKSGLVLPDTKQLILE